jgi:hypothetical protein
VAAERPLHVHFNRKSLTESLEKKFLNREREKRAPPIKKRISEANTEAEITFRQPYWLASASDLVTHAAAPRQSAGTQSARARDEVAEWGSHAPRLNSNAAGGKFAPSRTITKSVLDKLDHRFCANHPGGEWVLLGQ